MNESAYSQTPLALLLVIYLNPSVQGSCNFFAAAVFILFIFVINFGFVLFHYTILYDLLLFIEPLHNLVGAIFRNKFCEYIMLWMNESTRVVG
jgi:hypothetical protein